MNIYYIYIYLDPRKSGRYCYKNFSLLYKPIYVGKGKNRRCKVINGRTPIFINKFNKIKKSELKPIIFKLFENLNEKESLDKETELIKEINIKNPGILVNMTIGGDGISGYIHTEETKEVIAKKLRKNFKEIKNEFEERGYILLTEEKDYKDCYTKLNYICSEEHKGSISWSSFQQGKGCPICWKEKRKGEKSSNHKLTEEKVIQIKLLLKYGKLTQQEIADMFGVSQLTISAIKTGKTWSYIKV